MVGVVVEVVCLQDLTLKVSGKYFNFWLSYKGYLIKLLTCGREERERRERERREERENREREKREREEREREKRKRERREKDRNYFMGREISECNMM